MENNKQINGLIIWFILLLNVIILKTAYLHDPKWYWCLLVSVPFLIIGIFKWSGHLKWPDH